MIESRKLTKKQVPLYVAEGLIMEREKSQTNVAKMIADAIQQEHENLRFETSLQINDAISNHIPSQYPSRKIRRICACASPKTTKEQDSIRLIQKKSIRRIQDIVIKYFGRYRTWSLLQETLDTPY
ncbi:hypothetical protein Tco_1358990 [Tanacetum coccineum]